MTTRSKLTQPLLIAASLLISFTSVPTTWGQAAPQPVRVLVLDETKTLMESFQVNAVMGTLRQNPAFEAKGMLVEVASSYDLPLPPDALDEPFDLVVIFPLDLSKLQLVWMFGRPYFEAREPTVAQAATVISELILRIFAQQNVTIVGAEDDLVPALFMGVFLKRGWL